MRKLLLTGVALLFTAFAFNQSVILEVQGSPQVCAGFTSANQVKVTALALKTQFNTTTKTSIAYVWMAEHENGTKIWFSNQPSRWVPVPWPGQYRVRAIVEYIMPGRTRPFAAVSTNTVIITGVECNNP